MRLQRHTTLGLALSCLAAIVLAPPAAAGTVASAPVPQAVTAKATPDFDGDGLADYAFGDNSDSFQNLEVRYGSGSKATIAPAALSTGDDFIGRELLARDLNADGFTDLAFTTQTFVTDTASLCVALGSTTGLLVSTAHCTKLDMGTEPYPALTGVVLVEDPTPRLVVGISAKHSKLIVFDLDASGLPSKGYTVVVPGKGKVPNITDSRAFYGDLAAAGSQLFVGVPGAKVGSAKSAGAVVVLSFSANGISAGKVITQKTKGVAGAAATNNYFGYSLAAGDGYLAVGAIQDDVPGVRNTGAVHVFRIAGTKVTPVKRISQSSARVPGKSEYRDRFGSAVAIGRLCAGVTGLVVGAQGETITKGHESDGSAWLIPLRISSACPAVQLWEGHRLGGEPTYGRMLGDQVATIRDAGQTTDKVIIAGSGGYSDLSPLGVLAVWSPKTGRTITSENGLIEGLVGR